MPEDRKLELKDFTLPGEDEMVVAAAVEASEKFIRMPRCLWSIGACGLPPTKYLGERGSGCKRTATISRYRM